MSNEELIELAKKARENAYAPLSKFKVGAALITKNGKVFTGCNIEDPSAVGVTNICAERCALIKALSEGYDDFAKIAVVGGIDELIFCTPCGVCRQYLNTFCPEIIVVFIGANGTIRELALSDMLPYSFSETF